MNYTGSVSSVNTFLWTFELDDRITVHIGHLAAHNSKQMLPEVGEKVQIYNAHFKATKSYELERLFLCEKGRLICESYKTYARENDMLQIIRDYNLGVSDLLEISYNIATVRDFLKILVEETTEQIMLEVIRCVARDNRPKSNDSDNQTHKCLNKNVPIFTLKTISSCQYMDAKVAEEMKVPPWSFGTHSKTNKSDILIGYLQINKRYGVPCMYDGKHRMPCLITQRNRSWDKTAILNRIVLVSEYRIFTESYRETGAASSEYVLFDVQDVVVLNLKPINAPTQELFNKNLPLDYPYKYSFKFTLCKKAPVNIVKDAAIECWLDVLISTNLHSYNSYLGLNAYQVQLTPFLEEGETYTVYHSEKLKDYKHYELLRVKPNAVSQKFTEKTAIFVRNTSEDCDREEVSSILTVSQALDRIKRVHGFISFQGLLNVKKLTPKLSSRTKKLDNCAGFGTPGSFTHTLIFVDDTCEHSILLYLNNWENLQIPLGLVLDMRICVRNVLPQKSKYLKSSPMTTLEVLGYEPRVLFDTVILNSEAMYGSNKYTFLGLGDLIPCNVLVWARISQLHVRSLKIICKCSACGSISPNCTCGDTKYKLESTITLYVYDEMGQAVVISKSLELLRQLLCLEVKQWDVWCIAFQGVGEYIHDVEHKTFFSQESDKNAFCEALAVSVRALNAAKISNLDFMCRKMESTNNDNEGMPKWFCVDAQARQKN